MLFRAGLLGLMGLFIFSSSSEANPAIVKKLNKKYMEATCDETPFLTTSRLACVSCGVQKFTGLKPSEKYLALLGFTTDKYVNLGKTVNVRTNTTEHADSSEGGAALESFKRNIIQKVQAYGFCLEGAIDKGGRVTGKGYGNVPGPMMNLVFSAISGSRSTNSVLVKDGKKVVGRESSTGYTSKQEKELVKFFGFRSEDKMADLFQDDRWTYATPAQRQNHFREVLAGAPAQNPYDSSSSSTGFYGRDENADGLKECIKQMGEFANRADSIFNLSSPNPDNQELCQLMAMECEVDMDFCSNTPKPVPASSKGSSSGGSSGSVFDRIKKQNSAR